MRALELWSKVRADFLRCAGSSSEEGEDEDKDKGNLPSLLLMPTRNSSTLSVVRGAMRYLLTSAAEGEEEDARRKDERETRTKMVALIASLVTEKTLQDGAFCLCLRGMVDDETAAASSSSLASAVWNRINSGGELEMKPLLDFSRPCFVLATLIQHPLVGGEIVKRFKADAEVGFLTGFS